MEITPEAHQAAREVGTAVWVRMRNAGKTQEQLAAVLKMSQPAISRRLRGDIPLDYVELCLIAGWLRCAVRDLLPEDPSASAESAPTSTPARVA